MAISKVIKWLSLGPIKNLNKLNKKLIKELKDR